MFQKANDFIATGIKALIANPDKLHVLLATYNDVFGYESGPVDTGKEGLTIQVRNGNLRYSRLTDLVFFIGTPLWEIGSKTMDAEARHAQSVLESSLKIEAEPAASFIAVVYAGLSAFDEAVSFARRIKQEYPNAKLVIVTCDCELGYKSQTLEPILQSKEIETVVVTNECGGHGTMFNILEAIVDAWPAPARTPA